LIQFTLRKWIAVLVFCPREQVYEPSLEELREDYLHERKRWRGRFSRRWVTFCFTIKTVGLVAQSLWTAVGSKTRKLILALLAGFIGTRYAEVIREKLSEWFGRLLWVRRIARILIRGAGSYQVVPFQSAETVSRTLIKLVNRRARRRLPSG
jgi:hypothetical protein